MGEKIIVGPINRGLKTNRIPAYIDNDSFPVLINAFQFRGRIKRKRGTSFLGRFRRFLGTTDGGGDASITIAPVPIIAGIATFIIGTDIFIDGGGANPVTLTTNSSGTAILNRSTGLLTVTGSIALTNIFYLPTLPVMGLEDLILGVNQYPLSLGFDTTYSYFISPAFPYPINDVSFYKNPAASASLPGYVPKATWTPTTWNGQDYQQFWTINYEGALWATNGINIPFVTTNIGMQYKLITNAVVTAGGPPAIVDLTIAASGLVIGDFLFINEIIGLTGINFQTGYVINVVGAIVTVEFPNATIGGAYSSGGIAQYLTNRSDTTKDCLRFYDGDPTNASSTSPAFVQGHGWVNFAPPISQSNFAIDDLPAAQYYLVGARMIIPFKDRILFIGPVVQTSAAGSQRYLQDVVIYSQNGTPYYTASYTNTPSAVVDTPTSASNVFFPILVPDNQIASSAAYFDDQTGFGGFVVAGVDQNLITLGANRDVLITGFDRLQAKIVYSGNDILPFLFYTINSELGSGSTFSSIVFDEGVISRGSRGYIITNENEAKRFDLDIPDTAFQIKLSNNGAERFTSQRDYINEWCYLTYPSNTSSRKFNNQTLQYNYRDQSWAIFNESYTTYGSFRQLSGYIWQNIGQKFPTWAQWNEPWNAGSTTLLQPQVIAGNQQGFIVFRDDGTGESNSLAIQAISGNTITSPNHNLVNGDYITINGALGTVSTQVNGKIFSVQNVAVNTFQLNPLISAGTYLGGGLIKLMYVPFIQTKQFPTSWEMGRKIRLGPQQYLLTATEKAQITLLIYLSQSAQFSFNDGPIVPLPNSTNNSLVYSTVLYTCPESANLGLTAANTNLQMISLINSIGTDASSPQEQIWHRMNTSLIGDTIQVAFTLSDAQMRDINFINQFSEIELHGMILDVNPSQMLS